MYTYLYYAASSNDSSFRSSRLTIVLHTYTYIFIWKNQLTKQTAFNLSTPHNAVSTKHNYITKEFHLQFSFCIRLWRSKVPTLKCHILASYNNNIAITLSSTNEDWSQATTEAIFDDFWKEGFFLHSSVKRNRPSVIEKTYQGWKRQQKIDKALFTGIHFIVVVHS